MSLRFMDRVFYAQESSRLNKRCGLIQGTTGNRQHSLFKQVCKRNQAGYASAKLVRASF